MTITHPLTTDVAIIGAGPIGIELAIALQRAGVAYVLLEAHQIGDAFSQWPPHTHFFSTPEHVALAGVPVHSPDQQPITGEQYLAYLRSWSASQRHLDATGVDAVSEIESDMREAFGEPSRNVSWPLTIKACRKP